MHVALTAEHSIYRVQVVRVMCIIFRESGILSRTAFWILHRLHMMFVMTIEPLIIYTRHIIMVRSLSWPEVIWCHAIMVRSLS